MPSAKEREELKARLQKISQNSKKEEAPAVAPQIPEQKKEEDLESMEDLEAEFEAKRKALVEKQKKNAPAPVPEETEDEVVEETQTSNDLDVAIEAYQNNGKFRVELIYQLVQLNKNLSNLVKVMELK